MWPGIGELGVSTMPASLRAELQHALLEIRRAAEGLKIYEPGLVDQLRSAIDAHLAAVGHVEGLPTEARTQCERIVAQGNAVIACIERVHHYPAQITARADVLDRSGMLAKMIRDFLAQFARQR